MVSTAHHEVDAARGVNRGVAWRVIVKWFTGHKNDLQYVYAALQVYRTPQAIHDLISGDVSEVLLVLPGEVAAQDSPPEEHEPEGAGEMNIEDQVTSQAISCRCL